MFNDLFARFIAALGLFVAGLNLIGWGMLENGSARLRNPVWQFISSFYAFEIIVLKLLAGLALLIAAMFLAARFLPGLIEILRLEKPQTVSRRAVQIAQEVQLAAHAITPRTSASSPIAQTSGSVQHDSHPAKVQPGTTPIRRAPTPEELKDKAIDQILKGF